MNVRKSFVLLLFLLSASLAGRATVLYSEGTDLSNSSPGNSLSISSAGTYTVSGTLATTADGQDWFTISLSSGLQITGISYSISGGGFSGGVSVVGVGDYNGPGAGSGSIPGSYASYPLSGPVTTLVFANFSTGSSWTMTYTVTGSASAPSITTNPSNKTACSGGNTSFTAAASNATSYQWQVNQGLGFGNISNGGVYSGATSTTLTITGATSGMDGYSYRMVATGAVSPAATTTSATLTVETVSTSGSLTNVSCNGGSNGSATVTPSGGTTPYTYSWSPSGGTAATATGLSAGSYTVTVTSNKGCTATRNYTITQPSAISATTSQNNVSCNGGSNGTATVSVSGGTPGYTYSWSPSGGTAATATGLAAGNYTVTITDANACTATKNFTITQPPAISATSSQTNVSCRGGSNGTATVSVSGGTSPYSYSWSPSGGTAATATGLAAGSYTVTITDNNTCQTTRNFTITQPAASLSASITAQTNLACYGGSTGSATVAGSGGTAPYSYSWSPTGGSFATATSLSAGSYTATVTDNNGCTATANATLTQPSSGMTATITSQTNIACNGGSTGAATVSVTGGTPGYTYSWSPSGGTAATATGLSAGIYTVTATDANGCTTTKNATLVQSSAITASTSQTNVACNGGSTGSAAVVVTGGTPGYTYSWSPSGGTAATASGLSVGSYTVTITDANSCTSTKNFIITEPTALSASTSQTNVSCNGGSNGTASVVVSGGTPGYTYSWSPSGGTAATATGLAAGTYTVTITDANSCTMTKTFTITEPTALSASTSQTNVSCNGGSNGTATVTVSGGTPGYTYSWAPSGGIAATATGLVAGTYTVTVTDANACAITKNCTITEPTALAASTSQTNVSCNGGSNGTAGVNVTGGTGPYNYSWSPSGGTAATATGLTAGSYTVTVTDGNTCILTKNFTITQPTALTASTSQTNISCNGGSNGAASVVVSGGTPGYAYSWSPSGGTAASATGLVAGSYTVTITDANTCQLTKNFTLTQPTALTASTSQTNVSCNGGSNGTAAVVVSGGTPGYTYSWSPTGGIAATATGLTAGAYTVTITDANACTLNKNFTVTQPTAISLSTGSQTNVSCFGLANGSATVTPTGGTPGYTYSWSPSGGTGATASGLVAGAYTVTVTDANSCTANKTYTITQPPAIVQYSVTGGGAYCAGGAGVAIGLSGSETNTTYQLYNGVVATGSPVTGTGFAISFGNQTAAGIYTVIATNTTTTCTRSMLSSATVVINPIPDVNTILNQALCNGATTTAINFSGSVSGTTYSWINSATSIGLAASGTGNIAAFTATNITSAPVIATVTVTPSANSCIGSSKSFNITVNPTPDVNAIANQTVCNNAATTAVNFTGSVSGTSYAWVNSTTSIGLAASGTGNIASFTATASTNVPVLATVTVTPSANSCVGSNKSFIITVNPTPTVNTVANQTLCNGATTNSVSFSGSVSGTAYAWTNNTTSIGLAATGNGNIGAFTATNTTSVPVVATVTVTPSANSCIGNTGTFTYTVNPTPDVNVVANQVLCNNSSTSAVNFAGSVTGTSFAWTNNTTSIGLAASGSGNIASFLATNITTAPVVATVTVTPTANSCVGNTGTFTYTVNPTPKLSTTLTPAPICNNDLFTYLPASATTGTSFSWSRAAITGISNPAANGVNDPNESLENTTADPISVIYTYTLDANGCTNTQDVTVIVNPTPKLSSPLVVSPICNNTLASYTPTSATAGTSFSWTRAAVTGISTPASSGTGSISETLTNTTPLPVTVTYNYTLIANGCTNTQSFTLVVNPTPQLSTSLTGVICSDDAFVYNPASATPGTTVTWTRAQVSGITPATSSGKGAINEVLTNSTAQDINVTYVYTLTANGCSNTQNVVLTVHPTPVIATISVKPANTVCEQTMYQNFGASLPAPAGSSYIWTASNAIVWAQSSNRAQNALISFPKEGMSVITLTSTITSTGCRSKATYTVTVGANDAQNPKVIYINNRFVCLQNDVDAYVWGYDDVTTLDSAIIAKETGQDYYNPNPDFVNRNYWVMTMKNGCQQKSYYNMATGIQSINEEATTVRVYPNPATEMVNIEVSGVVNDLSYEVYDVSGKRIKSGTFINKGAQVDISDISAGVYMVTVLQNGTRVNTSRFIKN
ncbi:MAG: hypothetical protein BGO70_03220 [Bacteroidetes bacterium 43-93]|nr:T9SS type A sorting domain-containing protein [Bacteroidota bacterium]OJW98911.1 MAG: hypothetical protein BGO70_03220 [Bacteroidetes bacterium 43-93]